MEEIWKEIDGYDGRYSVSTLGRIRTNEFISNHAIYGDFIVKEKIRPILVGRKGYIRTVLTDKNKRTKYIMVHRLVANAFIQKIDGKNQVNHKNFDKSDNRVINLEWVTNDENRRHMIDGNRMKTGYDLPQTKLGIDKIEHIKEMLLLGATQREIGKKLNVCQQSISKFIQSNKILIVNP